MQGLPGDGRTARRQLHHGHPGRRGRPPARRGPAARRTFAKPFAISRYQVTAGELDAYLKATGVKLADGDTRPGRECIAGKPRYQQGPRQPAVCVDTTT
ncbi:SUMF1/EgtB/PvdO family nonheme iron enzyme [Pseudomonas aeruginosa]|nr:SUMF1/EgtB/PvdO family nonheme iron enzyme [Pseudomonas aeruginosa]